MNYSHYAHQFTAKANAAGYSADNIHRCLNYAEKLLSKNLPVIFNSTHFASLVGYNEGYLARAVVFTPFFYRNFSIAKNNGARRLISEPLPSLKEIQHWILKNILYHISVSKVAKAYIPGMTLRQNLVFHRGQPQIYKLDIRNFFGNIRRPQIERIFRHAGYSFYVSNLLSKICCLNETLPQGAPTSPYLSNLVMVEFDEMIYAYCAGKKIRYTRYADDLTFSGDLCPELIYALVKKELKAIGLEINADKQKIMNAGQRQAVTGVIVNQKIQVAREYRKKIRQQIFYIKKHGLHNHLAKINNSKANYLRHLLGKVLYVLHINKEDIEFNQYKAYINELIANS